jgi:cold shock CspA family protein
LKALSAWTAAANEGLLVKEALTRIGIFYDGSFFHVVSNYYAAHHPRRARLSISGLHEFVRAWVAQEERVDPRRCRMVEAHYFRGRFSAEEAEAAGKLFSDRVFDDVLLREGVTAHYLPMGPAGTEKGIDVWFALEAYELALRERFDVCVLVACDSDYVPLARKLSKLGTRVMVVGWDIEYTDRNERVQTTKTSQSLLNAVSYPVLLSAIIEDKTQKDVVRELFLPSSSNLAPDSASPAGTVALPRDAVAQARQGGTRQGGTIQNLIEREAESKCFGFITPHVGSENIWFGERDLEQVAFGTLTRGDAVTFELSTNGQGACAKHVRREGKGPPGEPSKE